MDFSLSWQNRLRRALDRPEVRLVSFDVFDTLLLRNTKPEPARFREIAQEQHKALIQAGRQPPPADDLFFARLQAAHIAYACAPLKEGERDATWQSILELMMRGLGWGAEPAREARDIFTRVELDYEAVNLRPNRPLVDMLARAASRGLRLVFLSDMYLDAGQIGELISRLAPDFSWDRGYASCEVGLTKRGGGLFRHVLGEEGVDADRVVHVGDDPKGDLATPRRLGITAVAAPRPPWWRMMRQARLRRFYRAMARRSFTFPAG